MLKAVETPSMLIKLINHCNLFQLQPSLIPTGSTGPLKMRDSLGIGTAKYRSKRLVTGPQEPRKPYSRVPSYSKTC